MLGEWLELHEGEVQTIGKETMYNFSRALRAYTKSQALARKVYNSLLPPPACPEDLGLQPYGYWE